MTSAIDGECKERVYDVDNSDRYPWDEGYTGDSDDIYHLNVPVTNEACLYNLWMCACWANQADACLCAFENPEQESVTVVKPTMGKCPKGAGPITDMGATGDMAGHAPLGFGALAL